jgi:hypothetical protein
MSSHNVKGGEVNYREFVTHLQSIDFKYEGSGAFRSAYRRGKVVVKVPLNGDGICDNRTEAAAWHKYKSRPTSKGYRLAPCRMLNNGCLMMVVVDRDVTYGVLHKEDWTYKIEGGQVGLYRGQIVAFDFALNIPERSDWEEQSGLKSEWFYRNGWNNSNYQ